MDVFQHDISPLFQVLGYSKAMEMHVRRTFGSEFELIALFYRLIFKYGENCLL